MRALFPSSALLLLLVAACTPAAEEDGAAPPRCPAESVLGGEALASSGTEHGSDDVKPGDVWAAADSPHRLLTSITVTGTLTLEPCAVVEACETCRIQLGTAEAEGDLIAVGDAQNPILVRRALDAAGPWGGLVYLNTGEAGRLSWVTVEDGDSGCGTSCEDAGVISVTGSSAATTLVGDEWVNAPVLAIDHSTVRGGPQNGVYLELGGAFAPGSEGNTITGNAGAPIRMELAGVHDTLLDGNYAGNGDDRVRLYTAGVEQLHHATVLRKLSIPWAWEADAAAAVYEELRLEAGVRLEMTSTAAGSDSGAELSIKAGGSLVLAGTAEEPVLLDAEEGATATPSWNGLRFEEGSGPSSLTHAVVRGAGLQLGPLGPGCVADPEQEYGAALLVDAAGVLVMTDTELAEVGANSYAVYRSYPGDGTPEFSGNGNSFTGSFFCSETDQFPPPPPEGPETCDLACCDHAYSCASDG